MVNGAGMIFGKTYSKLTFVLLFLISTLAIVPATALDDAGSVEDYSRLIVIPSIDNVKPGQPFTIDVILSPNELVSGVQFDLSFTGDVDYTVANVEEGDFFSKHIALTTFGSIVNSGSTSYSTIYSAALGPNQVSESGNLATIQIIAGSSTGYLDIGLSDVIVSNSNSQASPYKVENAKVLIDSKPVLSQMDPYYAEGGTPISFLVDAFDPDYDVLSFSSSSLPEGASLNSSTGVFEWTPSVEQAGKYALEFTVNDGYLSDQGLVTIFVNSVDSIQDADSRYMAVENDMDLDVIESNDGPNTDAQSSTIKDIILTLLRIGRSFFVFSR